MKDYKTMLGNPREVERKLSELNDNYVMFEGSLQDNYIFYDCDNIKFGRVKPRKYIILEEVYLNEWSSGVQLIMTDNLKQVNEFEELFSENECDEYEKIYQ